ncbi:MAG TPA: response regulator [Vicinamibacterales bacterium]|nr:response regulator [Vicinamibacterales bacterium]
MAGAVRLLVSRMNNVTKVLIADDDPTTRSLLGQLLLRDCECSITEVDNGVEALARLNEGRYSMLVLDMNMPFMGGLDTLEVIRNSALHKALPVIMVTAEGEPAFVRKALALGIADYLIKPLEPVRTAERLSRVLHALQLSTSASSRRK